MVDKVVDPVNGFVLRNYTLSPKNDVTKTLIDVTKFVRYSDGDVLEGVADPTPKNGVIILLDCIIDQSIADTDIIVGSPDSSVIIRSGVNEISVNVISTRSVTGDWFSGDRVTIAAFVGNDGAGSSFEILNVNGTEDAQTTAADPWPIAVPSFVPRDFAGDVFKYAYYPLDDTVADLAEAQDMLAQAISSFNSIG